MELDVRQALENASDKELALWPSRTGPNRLEPQCWPRIQPKFRLEPGSRVFTIGSCFARNIERALADLGFDIPVFTFCREHPELLAGQDVNVMNRYTPPSIFQELAWTQRIMDRDDVVRQDDLEPLLLDAGGDRVYDLCRVMPKEYGITREQALAERRLIYSLYRNAFDCEAVVITLGLIECWKDTHTGLYVEFNRGVQRNRDRFRFRRIDYVESLDYVERAIAILDRDRPKKILLTTSPVPLTRTFTRDDVIVANTYSKSVLRAVAGAVAECRANVDYFPSFESVMLTKDHRVWMDDLIHIEPSFVGSIMVRVTGSYAPSAIRNAPAIDQMYRVIGLSNAGDWAQAQAALEQLSLDGLPDRPADFFVCAAELAARRGDAAMVQAMATRAPGVDADMHLRCAKALEAVGRDDLASARRGLALRLATHSGKTFWRNWLHMLYHADQRRDLNWLLDEVEKFIELDVSNAWTLASIHERAGRRTDQERLLRVVLERDPLNEAAGLQLAHILIESGRREEGLGFLQRLADGGSANLYLHPLVRAHLKCGRPLQAKALIERLVQANPENPGLRQLASQCETAVTAMRRS